MIPQQANMIHAQKEVNVRKQSTSNGKTIYTRKTHFGGDNGEGNAWRG